MNRKRDEAIGSISKYKVYRDSDGKKKKKSCSLIGCLQFIFVSTSYRAQCTQLVQLVIFPLFAFSLFRRERFIFYYFLSSFSLTSATKRRLNARAQWHASERHTNDMRWKIVTLCADFWHSQVFLNFEAAEITSKGLIASSGGNFLKTL